MATLLITGANRGLGLALVRHALERHWRVHACCREPARANDLAALAEAHPGRCALHRLDVTDHAAIERLAATLEREPIDVVFNNAGVLLDRGARGLAEIEPESMRTSFEVNTIAPLMVARAFVPHLERAERRLLLAMTSRMGSIADNTSGRFYAYRASKAALNMVWKSLAIELAPRGITCVVLHPGWVRTAMGGEAAPLTPERSAAGLWAVIERLEPSMTGRFLQYDGAELPW